VGRYVGGVILGWRILDLRDEGDGGRGPRLGLGILVAIGMFLGMITAVSHSHPPT
jgi:hypothetical protein